jgi:hypothetical protein
MSDFAWRTFGDLGDVNPICREVHVLHPATAGARRKQRPLAGLSPDFRELRVAYSRAHRQTRNGAAMESMLRPNLPTWRPYLASIRIPAKNSANASWPWSGSTCETYWSGRTTTMQPVSRFTPRSSKMSPAFGSTQNIFS